MSVGGVWYGKPGRSVGEYVDRFDFPSSILSFMYMCHLVLEPPFRSLPVCISEPCSSSRGSDTEGEGRRVRYTGSKDSHVTVRSTPPPPSSVLPLLLLPLLLLGCDVT